MDLSVPGILAESQEQVQRGVKPTHCGTLGGKPDGWKHLCRRITSVLAVVMRLGNLSREENGKRVSHILEAFCGHHAAALSWTLSLSAAFDLRR